MTNPKLGAYKLWKSVMLPEKATLGSACFDLRFSMDSSGLITTFDSSNRDHAIPYDLGVDDRFTISPNERVLFPTGIIFDIPEGYSLRLHSRSSLALKKGLRLGNSEGIIDSDYKKQTFVMIHNTSKYGVVIRNGDRICQAELVRSQNVEILEIETEPKQSTERTGGFGSTGEK